MLTALRCGHWSLIIAYFKCMAILTTVYMPMRMDYWYGQTYLFVRVYVCFKSALGKFSKCLQRWNASLKIYTELFFSSSWHFLIQVPAADWKVIMYTEIHNISFSMFSFFPQCSCREDDDCSSLLEGHCLPMTHLSISPILKMSNVKNVVVIH